MRTDIQPRPPRFLMGVLIVALLFGVGATVLSILNAVNIDEVNDAREVERIASDLSSCERGNVGRQSDIDIAMATENLIRKILAVTFAAAGDRPAIAALEAQLEPIFDEHRQAVARIEIIDCRAVVPGADRVITTEAP